MIEGCLSLASLILFSPDSFIKEVQVTYNLNPITLKALADCGADAYILIDIDIFLLLHQTLGVHS